MGNMLEEYELGVQEHKYNNQCLALAKALAANKIIKPEEVEAYSRLSLRELNNILENH